MSYPTFLLPSQIIMSYTEEQLNYINYSDKNHTKLIACAGSGKTRCIINRINKLIENQIYQPDEILMLTFSRFTRDDYMNKIKEYFGQCNEIYTVQTIDSFAKRIIDPDGTVDVSLLSYRLMKFLETETDTVLKMNSYLNKIKIVFIDEAQDLDLIQYNIFSHMKNKLGIIINMVGDPNQNIYQFRNSSDKYLREFDAVVFKLTCNFRSHQPIVDFSKHLRPFKEHEINCYKGQNGCSPVMMFYEHEKILETNIIDLLESAHKNNIDLSEFAILSPTRGRMRPGGKSHGLCFVSNILYKSKIKFKQFYEESIDEVNGGGIKYTPTKGHVNVLTYMGSKGLEWNYVIIIDADACLINKRFFNQDKHNYDQYLLYVACSRAVQNMYIFSKCYFTNIGPQFNTNPWFNHVPDNLYQIDDRFSKSFFFPKLQYINNQNKYTETQLSKIIEKLNCFDLDELSNLIGYQKKTIKFHRKIFQHDYSFMEKQHSIFLSKFTENLFHALYNIKMNRKHVSFNDIENVIETDIIVSGLTEETTKWYYQNRKNMTWDKFNNDNRISKDIKDSISKSFDRTKPFNTHTIAVNGYYQWFILNQKIWIKNLYEKYLKCKNSSQIRELLFYLTVVLHGIDTQHYFHIKSKGKKYTHILEDYRDLFDEIEEYVETIDLDFISINEIVHKWGISSKLNLVDDNDKIWTVKCSNEITLKHILHSFINTLMYDGSILNEDFSFNESHSIVDVRFINLIKGDEICFTFDLQNETIKRIIDIIIIKNQQ